MTERIQGLCLFIKLSGARVSQEYNQSSPEQSPISVNPRFLNNFPLQFHPYHINFYVKGVHSFITLGVQITQS